MKKRRLKKRSKGKYRSVFEKDVATKLDKLRYAVSYEPETLDYILMQKYLPDWSVEIAGKKVYLEAKGKFNYVERRKILGVISSNPGIDLRLIFMRNNKISSKSGTRYTDWCTKHGIQCSVFPILPIGEEAKV